MAIAFKFADPVSPAGFLDSDAEVHAIQAEDPALVLDISTNDLLIDAIIARAKAKDWELYAMLKQEFFGRMGPCSDLGCYAQGKAKAAGLTTF
jgi:hypothetical protein